MVKEKLAMVMLRRLRAADATFAASLSRWSTVSADRDRIRGGDESAEKRAIETEKLALEALLEDIEDQARLENRRKAVAALEEAGVKSGVHGGWACLGADVYLATMIRELAVCRKAAGTATKPGVNREWGLRRGAELAQAIQALGVAAVPPT